MSASSESGIVSLWLFREPEDPADVGKDVLKDFCGVDYYDLDFQEGVYEEAPTGVRSLIGRLSYSASFLDGAVAEAEWLGVSKAYGVIAQFDFAYDPAKVNRPIARDPVFLGCFPWHESSPAPSEQSQP